MQTMLSGKDVASHNTRSSCWVIIDAHVYDVTTYLEKHPGGSQILLQYAGKDATAVYQPVHPKGTLDRFLEQDQHLGPVDPTTYTPTTPTEGKSRDQDPQQQPQKIDIPRLLSLCLSLHDIERTAEKLLSKPAWIYYSSAADGLGALENNTVDWRKVVLRPRLMRNVRRIDTSRTVLGRRLRYPFFIAPAARAGLANEDGEQCLARGAARKGIGYCVSSVASFPHNDISRAYYNELKQSGVNSNYGALWFQLYIANEKTVTLERIEAAKKGGYKALVITIDSPVIGKREEDERYRAETSAESLSSSFSSAQEPPLSPPEDATNDEGDGPLPLRGVHSSTFRWDDLKWIREAWQNLGPIALKGVQTAEDAVLAVEHGIDAIYLSNHGGRQCDDTPSSIHTLLEIRRFYPWIVKERKVDIFLDGSIRRGADVVKALCLGATAVALGRPFMYSVSMGDDGVLKAIQLLSDEIETTMRLIGATSIDQLNPAMVNTKRLELELVDKLDELRVRPHKQSKL
ncbi:hypothetical protein LTR64_006865 [Lithohypha guttulata]|uniref:uncharacterized protein n=1 Tax=Lithohypha guttulata TaxID=1690604 RepID=UPI002DDF209B|nr:hypothetical protein LTR51_004577 [Lithohypha guttulata]